MFALASPLLVYFAALVAAEAKRTDAFPDFVLKYAPLSYLHSDEQYWPTDVAVHLPKVIPEVDFKPVGWSPTLQTLSNFASNVYLTATDDVVAHDTEFFRSTVGKPVDTVSTAPATIIAVEKSGGIIDAFYFYFYSFNFGGIFLGRRFGNHVGDWEHTMVRFINGTPDTVYYSEHSSGAAYKYSAVEKVGVRPVSYIATGTHANYATSGNHTYEQAPIGNSTDQTNKGPIWDIAENFRGFWYNPSNGALSLALGAGTGGALEISEGPSWLNFSGYWGDQKWPIAKPGQYCVQDECLIDDGPTGPLSKNLGRTAPCQNESSCNVQTSL